MPSGSQPSFCVQSVVVGKEDTENVKKKRKKIKCPDEYDPSESYEESEESEEYLDYLRRCGKRSSSSDYFDPAYNFRFRSMFDSPLLCRRLPFFLDHCSHPFF